MLGDRTISYSNGAHGADKMDGSQIAFFGTGGDYYTRADEYCSGYLEGIVYGRNNGAWVVNITTNGFDTIPPAIPTGVSVQ